MLSEADKVALLRGNGASVGFTHTKPGSSSVEIIPGPNYYIKLDYIEEVVRGLAIKAALDSLTKADKLLLDILNESRILV